MIKSSIKKIIPKFVIKALRYLKEKLYDNAKKKFIFLKMRKKHKYLLNEIKGKEKVKIIFLVIRRSVWKVDPVFKKMLADPFFEPLILVIPDTTYNEGLMWEEMNETFKYFEAKGYPTEFAYKEESNKWTALHEMKPDIIFFTDPHNLTRKEYYEDAYLNYLSCYVPYFLLTTTHGGDQSIYNHHFHNAIWKSFMPHEYSMVRAKQVAASKAINCIITGYPSCEEFVSQKNSIMTVISVWKRQPGKKKIIFSPHHTIEAGELELSNFLAIADYMLGLANKYKDKVQWSFKPHPILKSKLFLHPDWGEKKTDAYYSFWESQEYTQLDEGEYTDLFIQSDAIIHDCGSFIAEYPFVAKPCAYLELNGESQLKSINDFGKYALGSYERIKSKETIVEFIDSVVSGKASLKPAHLDYLNNYVYPIYKDKLPSEKILEILTNSLKK